MRARPRIVVVGSLNVDHTLRVPHIPKPGETLTASAASTCFGGKGANQAVAAARAGGEVTLVGCVGEDDFGTRYREHLRQEGIQTATIYQAPMPTGSAFISVDTKGENSIVVYPGANHALDSRHLDLHADLIRSAHALLLQLECPLPVVRHAAKIADSAQVPVILNASPLTPEFLNAGLSVHTLIVNEHEVVQLTAMTFAEIQAQPQQVLTRARCRQLIITRGSHPTLAITERQMLSVPPPKVIPLDTVGAGDSFAGAFAVASTSGSSLVEVLHLANAAGALATQKSGAQTAIPSLAEIQALLLDQGNIGISYV